MTEETRRNVHAERERQHRELAEKAINPDVKRSHIQMADYHASVDRRAKGPPLAG